MLQHIHEAHLTQLPQTRKALEYEGANDVRRAYDMYSAGMSSKKLGTSM